MVPLCVERAIIFGGLFPEVALLSSKFVYKKKVFAAELIHTTTNADWRAVDPSALKIVAVALPTEIESMCVSLVKNFRLNFSTMDIILSEDGHYYFLDLNPNGQWLWVDLQTKQGMVEYFVEFLCS